MTLSSLARSFLAVVALSALAGCRHVVVDPQTVASRNDRDWTVHATPVPTVIVPAAIQPSPPR